MKNLNIHNFIFILILIIVNTSCQKKSLNWNSSLTNINKERTELVYCDSTSFLTIYDIINKKFDTIFIDLKDEERISYKNNVYWLKVNLHKVYEESLLLEMAGDYNACNVYVSNKQKNTIKELRSNNFFKWTYTLNIEDQNQIIYCRLSTPNYISGIGFRAILYSEYTQKIIIEMLYNGTILGIVLLCLLYTLFLYINLRENFYLFYFLYVFSFAFYTFLTTTNIHTIFAISTPHELYHYTIPFSFITIFLLLYGRGFLRTKNELPLSDNLLIGLIFLKVLLVATGMLTGYHILFHSIIDNFFIFTLLVIAFIRLKQGFRPARLFVLSLSLVYLAIFIHSIIQFVRDYRLFEVLGEHEYIFSFYNLSIMEIITFTFAMADHFRILKTEKEATQNELIREMHEKQEIIINMNRELEQKVKQRTEELFIANQEIKRINRLLVEDNKKLEQDVSTLEKNAVMRKKIDFEDFRKIFPNEETCLQYLYNLKWSNGYQCKKCHHLTYCEGKMLFSLRCTRCGYEESPTTNTIFYKIKFPIIKAFYLLFLVSEYQDISTQRISEMIQLRRQTCDEFKKKIIERIHTKKRPKDIKEGWSYLILDN